MIFIKIDYAKGSDPKLALKAAMSCANVTANAKVTLPTSCGHERYEVRAGGQSHDDQKFMLYWQEWHSAGGPPPPN